MGTIEEKLENARGNFWGGGSDEQLSYRVAPKDGVVMYAGEERRARRIDKTNSGERIWSWSGVE